MPYAYGGLPDEALCRLGVIADIIEGITFHDDFLEQQLAQEVRTIKESRCDIGENSVLGVDLADLTNLVRITRWEWVTDSLLHDRVCIDRRQSLDAVFSIRFMFHVPREVRMRILQEMARVSRRWLIVDLRHCYNVRWCFRRLCHGVGVARHMGEVWSRESLRGEAVEAGLQVVGIFSPRQGLSIFSDKWVVLLEKTGGKKGVPQA